MDNRRLPAFSMETIINPNSETFKKAMTILANHKFANNERSLGAIEFMAKLTDSDAASIDDALPSYMRQPPSLKMVDERGISRALS